MDIRAECISRTTQATEVPLPDDDDEAMSHLCMALHLKNDCPPTVPKVQQVRNLAGLVDKYDCVEAIRHFARSWLQDAELRKSYHYNDYMPLLEAAWLLNDRMAFTRYSKVLVLHILPRSNLGTELKSDVISDYVFEQMGDEADKALRSILAQLEAPAASLIEGGTAFEFPADQHGRMNGDNYKPGQHDWARHSSYSILTQPIATLETKGKLSVSRVLAKCSDFIVIEEPIWSTVRPSQAAPVASTSQRGGRGGALFSRGGHSLAAARQAVPEKQEKFTDKVAGCRACQLDLKAHLEAVIKDGEQAVTGLCLQCMKLEKVDCKAH